jgi:hypothetical protein
MRGVTWKPSRPSTSWALQTNIQGGAGEGFVVSLMLFYLLDVRSQVFVPGRIISATVGTGAGIRGASISSPSWSFFTTSKPVWHADFAGFVTMASAGVSASYGYEEAYLTFWKLIMIHTGLILEA